MKEIKLWKLIEALKDFRHRYLNYMAMGWIVMLILCLVLGSWAGAAICGLMVAYNVLFG